MKFLIFFFPFLRATVHENNVFAKLQTSYYSTYLRIG